MPDTLLPDCEGKVRRGTQNRCDLARKLVEEWANKYKLWYYKFESHIWLLFISVYQGVKSV